MNLCFIRDSNIDDLKNSHTYMWKLYYLFSPWLKLVGHMDVQICCKSSSPQDRHCWSDPLSKAFNQTLYCIFLQLVHICELFLLTPPFHHWVSRSRITSASVLHTGCRCQKVASYNRLWRHLLDAHKGQVPCFTQGFCSSEAPKLRQSHWTLVEEGEGTRRRAKVHCKEMVSYQSHL
jgi:hypothetical protein